MQKIMLKSTTACVVAAILVSVLAPLAGADATSEAKKQIQAAYNAENAAAAKSDIKGMLADYAPDYVATTSKGQKIDLATLRGMMGQVLAALHNIKAVSKVTALKLKGKQALATVSERVEGTLQMPTPDGKSVRQAKFVATDISNDVWVKGSKGWLKKQSKTVKETQTIDGKPMPAM